jgi:hypothetical protein
MPTNASISCFESFFNIGLDIWFKLVYYFTHYGQTN